MRGKARHRFRWLHTNRITPAYAGKRTGEMRSNYQTRDHPRICGEKSGFPLLFRFRLGSPPHMRGKGPIVGVILTKHRITPAYAGKRQNTGCKAVNRRDHPRICGEKQKNCPLVSVIWGSPPHMRGKARFNSSPMVRTRITPAYAGKRLKRSRSTVPHAAIVPLFPSVCNKPAGPDGSPAGHDAPPFLPIENAAPASPAYNLRSL